MLAPRYLALHRFLGVTDNHKTRTEDPHVPDLLELPPLPRLAQARLPHGQAYRCPS